MRHIPESTERISFTDGRLSNTDAISELEEKAGLSEAILLQQIPELQRTDLSFGLRWASEIYDKTECGQSNSQAVLNFVLIHIPVLNVSGDTSSDVSDINTSYHINVETNEIRGFSEFNAAVNDLSETHATATITDQVRLEHLEESTEPIRRQIKQRLISHIKNGTYSFPQDSSSSSDRIGSA